MSTGAGLSCCLHSEWLLTAWIKGSGRLLALLTAAAGTSQELERGPLAPEEHQSYFSGASWYVIVLHWCNKVELYGGVWCTLVLVLGSRTSKPHLLLAQAQAQAALAGIQKTGNNLQQGVLLNSLLKPCSTERPFETHALFGLYPRSSH